MQKDKSRLRRYFILASVLCVVGLVAGIWSFLAPLHYAARRASGGNDIASAWFACTQYAADHGGLLPPLDPKPGRLMFDRQVMYADYGVTGKSVTVEYDSDAPVSFPEYSQNPATLKNPDLIDDHSWWYLGYAVTSETDLAMFLLGYLKQVIAGGDFNSDLDEIAKGGMSANLKRLTIDASLAGSGNPVSQQQGKGTSSVPVFIERPGHYAGVHGYMGGWVVYADGHREFIEYPGKFPMTAKVIGILEAIDQIGAAIN